MKTALTCSLLLATTATAFATPSFQSLASNALHVTTVTESDGLLGVIIENRDGSITHEIYNGSYWTVMPPLPLPNLNAGQGLSAVLDYTDNSVYVFAVEQWGIRWSRSANSGVDWQDWCWIPNSAGTISTPSVVYMGPSAGFTVFAETSTQGLQAFGTTATSPTCSTPWTSYSLGTTTSAPVAVTWGGARYDVFGRSTTGRLVHWWSTNPGNTYGYEDSFTISGVNTVLPVSATYQNISAFSSKDRTGKIDVAFRAENGTYDIAKRLYYRAGWRLETEGSASSNALVAQGISLDNAGYGFMNLTTVCQTALNSCYSAVVDENHTKFGEQNWTTPSRIDEIHTVMYPRSPNHSHTFALDAFGTLYWAADDIF